MIIRRGRITVHVLSVGVVVVGFVLISAAAAASRSASSSSSSPSSSAEKHEESDEAPGKKYEESDEKSTPFSSSSASAGSEEEGRRINAHADTGKPVDIENGGDGAGDGDGDGDDDSQHISDGGGRDRNRGRGRIRGQTLREERHKNDADADEDINDANGRADDNGHGEDSSQSNWSAADDDSLSLSSSASSSSAASASAEKAGLAKAAGSSKPNKGGKQEDGLEERDDKMMNAKGREGRKGRKGREMEKRMMLKAPLKDKEVKRIGRPTDHGEDYAAMDLGLHQQQQHLQQQQQQQLMGKGDAEGDDTQLIELYNDLIDKLTKQDDIKAKEKAESLHNGKADKLGKRNDDDNKEDEEKEEEEEKKEGKEEEEKEAEEGEKDVIIAKKKTNLKKSPNVFRVRRHRRPAGSATPTLDHAHFSPPMDTPTDLDSKKVDSSAMENDQAKKQRGRKEQQRKKTTLERRKNEPVATTTSTAPKTTPLDIDGLPFDVTEATADGSDEEYVNYSEEASEESAQNEHKHVQSTKAGRINKNKINFKRTKGLVTTKGWNFSTVQANNGANRPRVTPLLTSTAVNRMSRSMASQTGSGRTISSQLTPEPTGTGSRPTNSGQMNSGSKQVMKVFLPDSWHDEKHDISIYN